MSDMTYRPLGQCGTRVSAFALGGWTTFGGSVTDPASVREILLAAYEAGVNFFDIADAYAKGECERAMGLVLRDLPRHELVISTKAFWPMSDDVNDRGLSRKHLFESIDKSLRRLGTDYVDLFFCHRWDPETPLEETARAMDDLVRAGKVLYWGTSEWTGEQLGQAHAIADKRNLYAPQVEQPQYSLLVRRVVERDVAPTAKRLGMGLVTWSPLGSGVLTGKYDAGVPAGSRLERIDWLREKILVDSTLERVRKLALIAADAGCTRAQLALAWTAAQPGVSSVITGATSLEQLRENLGALDVAMTPALAQRVEALFPVEPA